MVILGLQRKKMHEKNRRKNAKIFGGFMKNLTIAYKVLDRETRHGSNYTMLSVDKELYKITKILEVFFPVYTVGHIVSAVPNSCGIMCFNCEENAKTFMSFNYGLRTHGMLVKIVGINRLPTPVSIFSGCGSRPMKLLSLLVAKMGYAPIGDIMPPPEGIMCFESVFVIE
jgi:hypothetical protein